MLVSEITPDDLDEIKELQPDEWPDIIPYFDFYTKTAFCLPIKISLNKRIVGIGAAILHGNSAWLGHIIVHPEFRNKGFGSLVTQSLIEKIDVSRYHTISLIATDMGEPVYRNSGFKQITEYHFFKREEVPAAPFFINENIKDASPDLSKAILELDKYASGEDRNLLLKNHLQRSKVFMDKGMLLGFYLPSLGEGLIVAKEKHAGNELLKLSLVNKAAIMIPQENHAAIEQLNSLNFRFYKKGVRMSKGKLLDFRPEMLFSRIGGNLG